jgi:hypothetical protein
MWTSMGHYFWPAIVSTQCRTRMEELEFLRTRCGVSGIFSFLLPNSYFLILPRLFISDSKMNELISLSDLRPMSGTSALSAG